ncbi:MAG TPA: hypothetical protein VF662_07920 [Allosphingosinicella sp.]|jgi:hypothetical protein
MKRLLSVLLVAGSVGTSLLSPAFFRVEAAQLPSPVKLSGTIDWEKSDEIVAQLRRGANQLTVSSYGGNERAAMAIGRIVVQRQVEVRVEGACMSACAQYILLPASPRAIIEHGSVVGFHGSALALSGWSRRYFAAGEPYRTIFRSSQPISAEADKLISNARHKALLIGSFKALAPVCVEALPTLRDHSPRVRTTYQFWIPSRAQLDRAGIKFSGYWPADAAEAARLARQHFKTGTSFAFGGSFESHLPSQLPLCSARVRELE